MSAAKHTPFPKAIPAVDRRDFDCINGKASWWAKDGAWHIALPEAGRSGLYWTSDMYATREDAIVALAKAGV